MFNKIPYGPPLVPTDFHCIKLGIKKEIPHAGILVTANVGNYIEAFLYCNILDLEFNNTGRYFYFGHVTNYTTQQTLTNGRGNGDFSSFQISFIYFTHCDKSHCI